MDLTFSEEQTIFRKTVRGFLAKECPTQLVREIEGSELGYSPDLWRRIAELGWTGISLPEKYEGFGADFIDLVILYEEMGRNVFPSPHFSTVVLCGAAILECGNEMQKEEFLPKIAEGKAILALASSESGAFYNASMNTCAAQKGDDYVIDGAKLFVSDAHIADYLICAARTGENVPAEQSITLFLVDAKTPGITVTPLKTISEIGHDRQNEVIFENVRVPGGNVLGQKGQGWPCLAKVMQKATIALCAEMVGGAQAVLDMSVAYSKERYAFGHPIGSYQALQHKMADMMLYIDGAWLLTYQAAWRIGQGLPCAREVAMAKAWTSNVYRRVCADAIQIHGAFGFCSEVDTTLYFRRAKAAEVRFGDARLQRKFVAQELGL